jgi:O-antigen/teichoic acid export membrane protein
MSNFTKLLPQILQYNAMLGLSQSDRSQEREEVTFLFVKYSFLVSLATMAAYIVLGRFAIGIIAGTGVEEIYRLGLYIISGLCLFNTFRPLISYGIVVHDIRTCLWYAILPASAGTLVGYVVMGILYGAEGLAKANLLGGVLMVATTLFYIHVKTDFRWRFKLLHHSERELIDKIIRRSGR